AAPSRCRFSAIINNKTFQFMKKTLHLLGMVGKYYLYGFVFQLLFLNLMYASPTKGQSSLDIKEVYLNLDLQEASLAESFNAIKAQTGFSFIYDQRLADKSQLVNLQVKNPTLENVRLALAASHQLSFKQVDNRISVREDKRKMRGGPLEAEVTVSGTVSDANGEPLPGVTVSIQGTSTGTATDINGRYSIMAPEGATLIFSFIGFESQQVPIGDQSVINVTLSEDMAALDEVVVVGYGTQKKINLTAAVASIDGDEIIKAPTFNLSNSLVGRLPGLIAVNGNGKPGSGSSISIRGASTFRDNSALVVVDGIVRDFNYIDP